MKHKSGGNWVLNKTGEISEAQIDQLLAVIKENAEAAGYHLNPDLEFTRELVKSLLINERRYGYQACPCRLASGTKDQDLDIICPCDYRDPDLNEYGCCFCGLYVSDAALQKTQKITSIPERRPRKCQMAKEDTLKAGILPKVESLPFPVWRCKVCGYLCAREDPPGLCPICKAEQERFERFL
jgi:ferredoxin-thioredoxin reductase catalytic subunit